MAALAHVDRCLVEPTLRALDKVRSLFLRQAAPVTNRFVTRRNDRALAFTILTCCTALALSIRWTGYLLLLGPLVLGAPHLVAEARYLFFQRHRGNTPLLAVLVLQSALAFAGVGIYGLGICAAIAILMTRLRSRAHGEPATPLGADAALLALALLIELAAMVAPTRTRFALLHVHNGISLVVWLVWRKRPRLLSVAVASLLSAGAVAILFGVFDQLPIHTPLRDGAFSLTKITDAVAGGCAGPWRHRFLFLFCFMQSAHYAIWVRLLPEEARERETPRPFLASWRAFAADSGATVARLALLGAVAVPMLALLVGPVRARSLYVTASEFHATVELLLIFLLVRTRVPAARPRLLMSDGAREVLE
jgi:hypothetical protein